jgi:pimeloyl-ACP methyl ester carboxylesterase
MTGRWLLLRGLARGTAHWGSFQAALAARTGVPVLALDLPGNGARWREVTPASVAALAQDLHARLPPGGPVRLVAMSLGAMVALEACRRWPASFAGCAVLNTSAAAASPPWERLQPRQWPVLARCLWPGTRIARREQLVLAMTSRRPPPGTAQRWTALAAAEPVAAPNVLRQLWAAARWRAPREAPPVPLLLLASRGDALVAPACSQRLARQWRLPLHLHPWAGHDLPLDDPDWVLARLQDWARDLD